MAKPADTTNPIPRKCSVKGCEKPTKSVGLCNPHYLRKLRYGNPLHGGTSFGAPVAWLRENSSYDGGQCLHWPFSNGGNGRGSVLFEGQTMAPARAMCMIAHGPPPFERAEAAHSCGKGCSGCVAPNHLRWTTHAENGEDTRSHGSLAGERHGMSKLTAADVLDIRADRRAQNEIAKHYDVTQQTVSDIKRRKSWAHI